MSGGVTAASSVKLRLLRRAGAELGTSPSEWLRRPTPSPQSSRGQRKAITSLVFVAAQRVGWEGGHRGPWKAPSRECHLSKRRPGWELWQKGHSEAEERRRKSGPPECRRAGTDGWGMVCPTLPGPLGKAEPPGVASEGRRRTQSQCLGGGQGCSTARKQWLDLAPPGLPSLLLFPP